MRGDGLECEARSRHLVSSSDRRPPGPRFDRFRTIYRSPRPPQPLAQGADVSGENAGAVKAMGTNSVVGLAQGSMGLAVGGDTSLAGRLRLYYSGKVTIPAGATSASVKPPVIEGQPPAIGENTLAFATIQQLRKTNVRAVVLDPKTQTLTIYLTRPVARDTAAAWELID
jgi:hypothetical protein